METATIYTQLENEVINALRALKAQPWFTDRPIYIGDLEDEGMDSKRVRGALSSLVKKGAVHVNKQDGGLISLLID